MIKIDHEPEDRVLPGNAHNGSAAPCDIEERHWFVMRDLKRANANLPAYKQLAELGFEVFTPMKWEIVIRQGKRKRVHIPFVQDLLFVHSTRSELDPVVASVSSLQYRFKKGGQYCEALTVREKDMTRFIAAVSSDPVPTFYRPEEITANMYGREIHIIGGPLNGYTGRLLSVKGLRKKRLIVELAGLLKVAVEVNPEFIRFDKVLRGV